MFPCFLSSFFISHYITALINEYVIILDNIWLSCCMLTSVTFTDIKYYFLKLYINWSIKCELKRKVEWYEKMLYCLYTSEQRRMIWVSEWVGWCDCTNGTSWLLIRRRIWNLLLDVVLNRYQWILLFELVRVPKVSRDSISNFRSVNYTGCFMPCR